MPNSCVSSSYHHLSNSDFYHTFKIPFYPCEFVHTNVGIGLTFFNSSEDYARYVESQLLDLKAQFHSHSKLLDEVRRRPASSGQESGLQRLKTAKPDSSTGSNTRQIQVDAFRVLMNPSAEYEATILDEAIRTLQEKIEKLEKIQGQVVPLLKNSKKLAVIVMDDFPTAFMYYG